MNDYVRLRHVNPDGMDGSNAPTVVGCPECGCTNPGCETGCRLSKIDQIYAWLEELMPVARAAAKLFNAKAKLMSRWVK